jgi:hypothetical protein
MPAPGVRAPQQRALDSRLVDMRDLGRMLENERPLPHPAKDAPQ